MSYGSVPRNPLLLFIINKKKSMSELQENLNDFDITQILKSTHLKFLKFSLAITSTVKGVEEMRFTLESRSIESYSSKLAVTVKGFEPSVPSGACS